MSGPAILRNKDVLQDVYNIEATNLLVQYSVDKLSEEFSENVEQLHDKIIEIEEVIEGAQELLSQATSSFLKNGLLNRMIRGLTVINQEDLENPEIRLVQGKSIITDNDGTSGIYIDSGTTLGELNIMTKTTSSQGAWTAIPFEINKE